MIPLRLKAASSKVYAALHSNMYGTGRVIGNIKQRNEIILEIVKYLEESGLQREGVSKTIENEVKEENGGFLGMLATTLGTGLLANVIPSKGKISGG